MDRWLVIGIVALASLTPAVALAVRGMRAADDGAIAGRSPWFWPAVILGAAGPAIAAELYFGTAWRTGLAPALWSIIAATMSAYALLSIGSNRVRRLGLLLFPYLLLLGTVAVVWSGATGPGVSPAAPGGWVAVHIAAGLLTYALLTLAAIAGCAVLLQERALKAKRRPVLAGALPALADAELMQVRLLAVAEAVLLVGLLSGMATNYLEVGRLLPFDHKTLFTFGAFLVIGGLLFAHYRTGIRGRRAARIVLTGYLLVTLGFPGVKFVTDVVL